VCHGATPVETFTRLSEIVEDMVNTAQAQGLALPPASTRPMREAVPA
jgi:predicted RNase H-like HicB family nuclease